LEEVQEVLKGVKGIDFVYLDDTDVVRHEVVQRIIKAYERFEKERQQNTGRLRDHDKDSNSDKNAKAGIQ
jgi:phosphate starvation-inducible PhoH-like protein